MTATNPNANGTNVPHIYDINAFVADRVTQLTVAAVRSMDSRSPDIPADIPALMQKLETEVRRILSNKSVA